jgi:hypothetical protein
MGDGGPYVEGSAYKEDTYNQGPLTKSWDYVDSTSFQA